MNRLLPTSRLGEAPPAYLEVLRGPVIALARVGAGCLYAANAIMTAHPTTMSALAEQVSHQQSWLLTIIHPVGWLVCIALFEGILALGLLTGAFTNLMCGLGIGLALLAWAMGDVLLVPIWGDSGLTGDIGIILVSILSCIGLILGEAGRYYGFDRRLVQHLGRWSFLTVTGEQKTAPVTTEAALQLKSIVIIKSMEQALSEAEEKASEASVQKNTNDTPDLPLIELEREHAASAPPGIR